MRVRVGQRALQPVADLDAHLAIAHEKKSTAPCVVATPPDLPVIGRRAPVNVSNGTSPVVSPIQTIT